MFTRKPKVREVKEVEAPKPDMSIPVEALSLTPQERIALQYFVTHEGFKPFVKIMNAVCYESTSRLINTDPSQELQVKARQIEARCKHEFCSRLLKLVNDWRTDESIKSTRDNPTETSDVRQPIPFNRKPVFSRNRNTPN